MKKGDFSFFSNFWAIAKLYLLGEEKWGALALLFSLILLVFIGTQFNVVLNTQYGNMLSALVKLDLNRFWQTILIIIGIQAFLLPMWTLTSYLRGKLTLYWRRWLTTYFLKQYFQNRSFYNLNNFHSEIDNPDQRIAVDVKNFSRVSVSFFYDIFGAFLTFFSFILVLWHISKTLTFILAIYVSLGMFFTISVFGKKLVKMNSKQIQKEGNFRFGLVRVRENSESIAFYQGEDQEFKNLNHLFKKVFNNSNDLIVWTDLFLSLFERVSNYIPHLIPAMILAPMIISGEMEIGKINESKGAFLALFRSLYLIVRRFETLTAFTAGIDRLFNFNEFCQQEQQKSKVIEVYQPKINFEKSQNFVAKNLTLYTPNYQRVLFHQVSIEVRRGESLLIMGNSGCGKSSLLRAFAGLWNSGEGTITRPSLDEILFIPQRPYMILGTLRSQLIYPQIEDHFSDETLYKVLQQVNLPDLADKFGGFDVEKDWDDTLSLGEQQRIAFARILINHPKYVILDEATSALDIDNERYLYQHLMKTNTTFISVGHRPTLFDYHEKTINLSVNCDLDKRQAS